MVKNAFDSGGGGERKESRGRSGEIDETSLGKEITYLIVRRRRQIEHFLVISCRM